VVSGGFPLTHDFKWNACLDEETLDRQIQRLTIYYGGIQGKEEGICIFHVLVRAIRVGSARLLEDVAVHDHGLWSPSCTVSLSSSRNYSKAASQDKVALVSKIRFVTLLRAMGFIGLLAQLLSMCSQLIKLGLVQTASTENISCPEIKVR
jgi:hypothetical protein